MKNKYRGAWHKANVDGEYFGLLLISQDFAHYEHCKDLKSLQG